MFPLRLGHAGIVGVLGGVFPQGLKPLLYGAIYGTAEAVPLLLRRGMMRGICAKANALSASRGNVARHLREVES
jgi:hypothetical protein